MASIKSACVVDVIPLPVFPIFKLWPSLGHNVLNNVPTKWCVMGTSGLLFKNQRFAMEETNKVSLGLSNLFQWEKCMSKEVSRVKLELRTDTLKVRVSPRMKLELSRFASEVGLSSSALVYANIKHMLREEKVSFALPGERIAPSEIEKKAARRRALDYWETVDWSKMDYED